MIMDSHHLQHHHQQQPSPIQRSELQISTLPSHNNNNNKNNNETHISPTGNVKSSIKRSFDVAFLMMPDERIKQKQAEKQARITESIERQYPTDLSPRQIVATTAQQHHMHHLQALHDQAELFNLNESRRYPQITVRSPRIYDDPTVIIPDVDTPPVRSAFTKVNSRLESPVPPSLSPDQLSCPSMSPPISTTPPRSNSTNGNLLNCNGNNANGGLVYQSLRPEYQFSGAFQSVNQVQALAAAQNHRIKQQLMYRPINPGGAALGGGGSPPDFLPGYAGFPFPNPAAHPFVISQSPDIPGIVRSPAAAAILSTLIPPTLASTFSLTAQNVCAKCNISFRMTSDLVYHMRSHHKSEVACDPNRRKREEKLKCPVCNESFRERHHLTRHMTAHQDKESDHTASASGSGEILNVGTGGNQSRHHGRASSSSK